MRMKWVRIISAATTFGPFRDLEVGQVRQMEDDLAGKAVKNGIGEITDEPEPKADPIEYMQQAMDEAQRSNAKGGPVQQKTAFDKFQELVGSGDYIEIFAPAGYGKSRLLAHAALEARRAGKKVLYLDCEHSLPKRFEKELGDGYQRLDFMDLDRIIERIAALPKGIDAVFYDSIGFPVLIKFVKLNLRERGDAIAKTILLRGYLKHYAETNNALAIATNQPVSELYGMSHELEDIEHRPPVGGKSIHIAKAVLRLNIQRQNEKESVFELRAFECQDMPFNKLLATFTIDGQGERLEWK